MTNYDIGIGRPSGSHWAVPHRRRADLRLAGLPQQLLYGLAAPCVNFTGQEQQSALARHKSDKADIRSVRTSTPDPDNARKSIDSHRNRHIAHLFLVSNDYCEFVTISGRLM
jgi:hypothetical protein